MFLCFFTSVPHLFISLSSLLVFGSVIPFPFYHLTMPRYFNTNQVYSPRPEFPFARTFISLSLFLFFSFAPNARSHADARIHPTQTSRGISSLHFFFFPEREPPSLISFFPSVILFFPQLQTLFFLSSFPIPFFAFLLSIFNSPLPPCSCAHREMPSVPNLKLAYSR